jgi:hypothetical protein
MTGRFEISLGAYRIAGTFDVDVDVEEKPVVKGPMQGDLAREILELMQRHYGHSSTTPAPVHTSVISPLPSPPSPSPVQTDTPVPRYESERTYVPMASPVLATINEPKDTVTLSETLPVPETRTQSGAKPAGLARTPSTRRRVSIQNLLSHLS